MVSKNNRKLRQEKAGNKRYRFTLKKLSVGLASVAVGAGLIFGGADVNTVSAQTETIEQQATQSLQALIGDTVTLNDNGKLEITGLPEGMNISAELPNGEILQKAVPFHGRWNPLQTLDSQRVYTGDVIELSVTENGAVVDTHTVTVVGDGETRPEDQAQVQYGRHAFTFVPTANDSRVGYFTEPGFTVTIQLPNGETLSDTGDSLGQTSFSFADAGYTPTPGETIQLVSVTDRDGNEVDLTSTELFQDPSLNQSSVTVYGEVPTPSEYSVSIDANGGTIDNGDAVVAEGDTYTVPYAFQSGLARDGYTLTGYTVEGELLDSEGNVVTEISKYPADYTPQSDVTLSAVWEVSNGKFEIKLQDNTTNYPVTLTAEDGTVYDLSSNSYSSSGRNFEAEDIPNGTYTLSIEGFDIAEAAKNGHPDTVSDFVVNEDGTATVTLNFEDDSDSSFIRYNVTGAEEAVEVPAVELDTITQLDGYVSGKATAGNTVVVLDAEGNEVGRDVASDRTGGFQVNLPEGDTNEVGETYTAYQVDADGNESERAEVTVQDADAMAQLTIDPVQPGAEYITGTVNPEAESVTVIINGAQRSTNNIDENGNWSIRTFNNASDLTPGATFSVRPRVNGKTLRYEDNGVVEEAAVEVPSLDVISDLDNYVSGKATIGNTVVVLDAEGNELGRETARERTGGFQINLPEGETLTAGDTYTVYQIDEFGNESDRATVTVLDADELAQLTVDPIYPGAEYITGTVNPDAESVFVKIGTSTRSTSNIDEDGNWSIRTFNNADDLVKGETIDVQVRVGGTTIRYEDNAVVQGYTLPRPTTVRNGRFNDGETITAADLVTNKDEFPEGTTFVFWAYRDPSITNGSETLTLDASPNEVFNNIYVNIRAINPNAESHSESFRTTVLVYNFEQGFDTVYRANGELDYGERVVVQEGEAGYVDSEGNVTREAVDEIIEVGNVMRAYENEPFYREYVADPNLAVGEEEVLVEGNRGEFYVDYTWEVNPETGEFSNRSEGVVSEVIAEAQNTIIGVGNVETSTEAVEFEVESFETDLLAVGETLVLREGVNGELVVTTTYTIDPETGELTNPVETTEETDAVSQIILVGTRVDLPEIELKDDDVSGRKNERIRPEDLIENLDDFAEGTEFVFVDQRTGRTFDTYRFRGNGRKEDEVIIRAIDPETGATVESEEIELTVERKHSHGHKHKHDHKHHGHKHDHKHHDHKHAHKHHGHKSNHRHAHKAVNKIFGFLSFFRFF